MPLPMPAPSANDRVTLISRENAGVAILSAQHELVVVVAEMRDGAAEAGEAEAEEDGEHFTGVAGASGCNRRRCGMRRRDWVFILFRHAQPSLILHLYRTAPRPLEFIYRNQYR